MKRLILGLLVCALPCLAQAPLPLETLTGYGCVVERVNYAEGTTAKAAWRWRVNAWAEHGGKKDWPLVLSLRGDRRQAFKDCDKWMKSVEKNLKSRK
jgi:hypothetical protein